MSGLTTFFSERPDKGAAPHPLGNEFITFGDWWIKRLAQDPLEAAALPRAASEEADEDPQSLTLTLHYITAAHSGSDDPGSSLTETTASLNAPGRHRKPESLRQAANIFLLGAGSKNAS